MGNGILFLQTPGGEREVDADLAVDADGNVTGKWGNADVAGTYKDGKLALDFQFTSEEVGATAAMKIDGKLDDTAALAGDWAFSEYNGTYKAMRPGAPVHRRDSGTLLPRLQIRHQRRLLTQSHRPPDTEAGSAVRSNLRYELKCSWKGPGSTPAGPFSLGLTRFGACGWLGRSLKRCGS